MGFLGVGMVVGEDLGQIFPHLLSLGGVVSSL